MWKDSFIVTCVNVLVLMPSIAQPCPLLAKAPPNGTLTCSHPRSHSSYGSHCEFECDSGFWLRGASAITCNSSGVWSQDPPTCQRECLFNVWNLDINHCSYTRSAPQPSSARLSVFFLHPCLWTAPILWKNCVLAPSVFSLAMRGFPWTAHRRWHVCPLAFGVTHHLPA